MKRLGFDRPILWLYHAEQYPLIGSFGERLVIYDCVDEYTTFPSLKTAAARQALAAMEERLLRTADIVFATNPALATSKRLLNPHTYFVPNVGDVAHFGRVHRAPTPVPADLRTIPRPRIGYVGALARYRIDFGLIESLARNRPRWSFVLIGPVTDEAGESVLPRRENIFWLGGRDYDDLPSYIGGFDACMLPYDINPYTSHAFPLKFHEFLGTGRPVVATALPAFAPYAGVVPLARTHDEFLESLEAILLGESQEARERRLEVAAANSWEHRIGRMTEIIKARLAEMNA